jgi:voltage-gated potassium channel
MMNRVSSEHSPYRRLWLLLGLAVLVLVYGVAGYMVLGQSLVDALFMTALALTTAGFTPTGDLSDAAKTFTVSIAIFGVTIFLLILALLTSAITEGRIGVRGRRRRMDKHIDSMKDHFIVTAYGHVGRTVARELIEEGVPFVVVERKEELEEVMERDGVPYIVGDPTSEEVLKRAGVERARGLMCAVDSDANNVYITLMARSLNPKLFIVGRSREPETEERLRRAGADRVVSPYVSSGEQMALLALRPRVVDYMEMFGRGDQKIRLDEIIVEAGSPLIGRALGEVCGQAVALLLLRQGGETVPNPPPEVRLVESDVILLLGEPQALRGIEG